MRRYTRRAQPSSCLGPCLLAKCLQTVELSVTNSLTEVDSEWLVSRKNLGAVSSSSPVSAEGLTCCVDAWAETMRTTARAAYNPGRAPPSSFWDIFAAKFALFNSDCYNAHIFFLEVVEASKAASSFGHLRGHQRVWFWLRTLFPVHLVEASSQTASLSRGLGAFPFMSCIAQCRRWS